MAAHHPHEPYGLSEAMGCDNSHLYPAQETRASEPSNAFGKDGHYQTEFWSTQGYGTPFKSVSSGYPSRSSEAIVSALTSVREASCEPNSDAPPRSQQPTTLGDPSSESFSTAPDLRPFDAAPSLGGCDYSEDHGIVHYYASNYHDVPHDADPIYVLMADSETSGVLATRTTTIPDQGTEQEPQHTEELVGECPQEVDQYVGLSSFRVPSPEAGENSPPPRNFSLTSRYPSDSKHILKFLKKSDGGRATCLWASEGDTCGFFSQVDLVKRHIKRMHYCLKPCPCKYCGRSFFNNYALKLHYNSHTGEKPFLCEFCGRGFASPSGKSHHRVYRHGHQIQKKTTRRGGRPRGRVMAYPGNGGEVGAVIGENGSLIS